MTHVLFGDYKIFRFLRQPLFTHIPSNLPFYCAIENCHFIVQLSSLFPVLAYYVPLWHTNERLLLHLKWSIGNMENPNLWSSLAMTDCKYG